MQGDEEFGRGKWSGMRGWGVEKVVNAIFGSGWKLNKEQIVARIIICDSQDLTLHVGMSGDSRLSDGARFATFQ